MSRSQGFTLVEVTIVATLLTVIMAIVGSCLSATNTSLRADDRIATAMETLARSTMHIAQIMRPCALTSVRVPSTAADVPDYADAEGEWMEPIENDPRPALQFRAATGELSLNAAQLTDIRSLRLVLDRGESDNDLDDDGDGMIDEGRVMLDYDGIDVSMATNVESCQFTLAGRLLTVELRAVVAAGGGRMQRFVVRETLYLRNN